MGFTIESQRERTIAQGEMPMRRCTVIILAVAALAGGVMLNFGDSRQALGSDYKLEMPKEAFGFSGTLSAQVVKAPDKVYGWFEIKVVKVVSFARNNKTRLRSPVALTKVWKDKYVAILGVKGMPELKVGDMVTVVAATHEVHLRATKVSKDKPVEAKPNGESGIPQKRRPGSARPEMIEGKLEEPLGRAAGQADSETGPRLLEKLQTAPANSWIEVPNSALMRVAPKPDQFPKTWAVCGPASVVMAWCGAALDTKRDRLVIWGGGHADYHGNELYAFDIQKLAWQRLTDPFPNPVNDQEVNADGTPNSRHTYGGLAYLTHADRFFGLGGSLAGVGFAKCDRTWTYDFDAKKWEDRQPGGKLPGGGFCLGCAYDPVSKKLFFGSEHNGLFAYDYDKNTWCQLDNQPVDGLGFAVNTKRKLLVGAGRGRLVLYDIGRGNFRQQNLKIPGGEDVIRAGNAAGLDYDPVSDRIVGWAAWAPGKVYALDLDAKRWEVRETAGGPKVAPSARNGVFGRWRYVPSVNAFVAVSDANANVFFYKFTAGTGRAAKVMSE
jgi:hypothetical protein